LSKADIHNENPAEAGFLILITSILALVYLFDAPDMIMRNRHTSLFNVPEIGIGKKPIDGGHYLLTPE
jgi:hypothetical protein